MYLFYMWAGNTSRDVEHLTDQIGKALEKQNHIQQCQLDNIRELRIEMSLFREDLRKCKHSYILKVHITLYIYRKRL